MSTLRQIEANRRNSQKSTGPTSVTGKAASSMNALKTGIHAKSLVLPSEKLADLELLIEEYYQRPRPASPEARALVDDLIYCEWLQRRLRAAETQLWAYDHEDCFEPHDKYPLGQVASHKSKAFGQLQWRFNCTRRASQRALQELKELQAEAQAAPASAPPVEAAPPALQPPSKPPPRPSTPRRSRPAGPPTPVSTSFTSNHFTPNWLRSGNPHPSPTSAGANNPAQAPTTAGYWVQWCWHSGDRLPVFHAAVNRPSGPLAQRLEQRTHNNLAVRSFCPFFSSIKNQVVL